MQFIAQRICHIFKGASQLLAKYRKYEMCKSKLTLARFGVRFVIEDFA
jgi:hypothetical protein